MELLSYPSMSESEELIVRDFLDKIIVVDLDNKIKDLAIAFRKNYKLKLPDAIVAASFWTEVLLLIITSKPESIDLFSRP
ncbi:MAG: type II toxin-antitoxin system VapC family toxin [Symploca sp. SIO2D2]|nr:type II toxin-antitoxin system VapC family toxin [Symploca sp. SIO2D2]